MTNYDRVAMRRINGVSREQWARLVADAKKREDRLTWLRDIGAPATEAEDYT